MKILYLAPLVPAAAGNGGKRAIFNHLEDVVRWTVDVDLIVVDIDGRGEPLPPAFSVLRGRVYPRALPHVGESGGVWAAACQLLFDRRPRGPAVVASAAARQAVRDALRASRYDVIVIDHLNAASLVDGIDTDVPIQYIAHNVEADILRQQRKKGSRSLLAKLRLSIELAKMLRFEAALLHRAAIVTAIASTDCAAAPLRRVRAKTVVWPELPDARVTRWTASGDLSLLFVGSAAYFPNRDAIEWLVTKFMPALQVLVPGVVLRIAGTAAKDLPRLSVPTSVRFEGFVSTHRLDELHRISDLFICPVVLGSGIKIKVLEATGHGLPVAATQESLAGIDYLEGTAVVITRDAGDAARAVASFLGDPQRLEALSARTTEALLRARAVRAPLVRTPGPRVSRQGPPP